MNKWIRLGMVLNLFLFSFTACALTPIKEAEDRRKWDSPLIKEWAESHEPERRLEAVRAMGRIQNAHSIPTLLKLLEDSERKVREEALFALGQLGWKKAFHKGHDTEIEAALLKIALNGKERDSFRRLAIEAYGKYGFAETPAKLAPLLDARDPELIAATLLALYRYRLVIQLADPQATLPQLSENTLQKMKKLVRSPSTQVRMHVAYYFARVKDPRGFALIKDLVGDSQTWVRFFATSALTKMAVPEAAPLLRTLTRDSKLQIQVAALQGLTTLKTATGLSPKLERDHSYQLRMTLVQAYAQDPKISVSKIESFLSDESAMVRAEAFRGLISKNTDQLQTYIQKGLRDPSWVVRQTTVEAIAALSTPQVDVLNTALADADVRVRGTILSSMAEMEGAVAWNAIRNGLSSSEIMERGSAIEALGKRKETDALSIAWTTYENSQDRKWVEARESLVDIFAATPGNTTQEYLVKILSDPAPSVAEKAKAALEKRGLTNLPALSAPELTFSPYRELEFKKNPRVKMTTTRGTFVIECYPNEAPIHVANFVGLVKSGFYDGLPWHRVVLNFVIQGGDPDGTGWGDGGYSVRAEVNQRPFERGSLGMPRSSGFDTGGVQVFFNHIPTPHLDGQYTVFGKIVDHVDVLDSIEMGDKILKAELI